LNRSIFDQDRDSVFSDTTLISVKNSTIMIIMIRPIYLMFYDSAQRA